MIKSAVLSTAERIDAWFPPTARRRASDADRLIVLLVHSLYRDHREPEAEGVFPHERMTVSGLRRFLEIFQSLGYQFIAPADVAGPDPLPHKAALLTFDDGYFNFVRAIPVLREYAVPAVLFVSPGCVVENQLFWWDAFYRGARARGLGEDKIRRGLASLRQQPISAIRDMIQDQCGSRAFEVADDCDRPLRLDELKELARDRLVHIGNHTLNHVALPFQPAETINRELDLAHHLLERELNTPIRAAAFPNGDYSEASVAACHRLGYEMGFTIQPRWNRWNHAAPITQRLTLGRYMLAGDRDIQRQANSVDHPRSLASRVRGWRKHRYR